MRLWQRRVALFSLVTYLVGLTPVAQAAALPLGTASGSDASLTTDGAHWTPLDPGSHPLYTATSLRAGTGTASALLHDQTQLELQPGTRITLTGTRSAPIVTIRSGRLFFRAPSHSAVTFMTPTTSYRPAGGDPHQQGAVITAQATALSTADPIGAIAVDRRGQATMTLQAGEMLSAPTADSAVEPIAEEPAASAPPDISRALGYPEAAVPTVAPPSGAWGVPTAVGIGVAAGGLGVGIGLSSSHDKKASPSAP
jgi:ferric-dicitrate binding protein FerR (iron transport regulator)